MTPNKQFKQWLNEEFPVFTPCSQDKPAPLSDAVVGQWIQLIAHAIALVVAFVYVCGFTLGKSIHQLNDFYAKYAQLPTANKVGEAIDWFFEQAHDFYVEVRA